MSTTKESQPFFGKSKGELMSAEQRPCFLDARRTTFLGLHKSFGLTVAALAIPRVALRLTTKVPAHLPAGDYVLGYRYDCEATAQVWSNCADITLAAW